MFETSGATAVSSNENKGEEIQVRTDTKRQMQHTGRNGRSGVSIPNAQGRLTRGGVVTSYRLSDSNKPYKWQKV